MPIVPTLKNGTSQITSSLSWGEVVSPFLSVLKLFQTKDFFIWLNIKDFLKIEGSIIWYIQFKEMKLLIVNVVSSILIVNYKSEVMIMHKVDSTLLKLNKILVYNS